MNNLDNTQPTRREPAAPAVEPFPEAQLSNYQPVPISRQTSAGPAGKSKPRWRGAGCVLPLLAILLLLALYLIFPLRTNIILFGTDDRAEGGVLGRSDTLILLTFKPVNRYIGMLSIPRDLWVTIPGVGENRINTAHFFAEAAQPGSGPQAVKDVIKLNFGVDVNYYVRARFDSFKEIITILGGVQINLPDPMGGYDAGTHVLDADQALAFVRDRTSGGDDFARMRQTQALVNGLIRTALIPANILKWPLMVNKAILALDTDLPFYLWPRLVAASFLANGIDGRVITREMVKPFTTNQGAQVLGPNWDLINPVLLEMFGQ